MWINRRIESASPESAGPRSRRTSAFVAHDDLISPNEVGSFLLFVVSLTDERKVGGLTVEFKLLA
jgi:hypothetical protein